MPKNDDEVAASNAEAEARIAKLRQQVTDEEAKRDTILRDSHDAIMAAKLAQEEERLAIQLTQAREANKSAQVSTKEQVKAAGATVEEAAPRPDGAATLPTGEIIKDKE